MPSQAHKIPRHGVFIGLAFTTMAYWQVTRRKDEDQLEGDLPYLAPGNAPLHPAAAPPASGHLPLTAPDLKKIDVSKASTSSAPVPTHATMPLYPLGNNPGGDGPSDDPDLSHMGMQVDWGNRLEKRVQIVDLEKVENPTLGSKGYTWQHLTDNGAVMYPRLGQPAVERQLRNPCSELYADLIECEQKFGWRAHLGDRMSMHEHTTVCSPEKRKFFRCREASRARRERLYRLRLRQSRGELVGLQSDPTPGEAREFDLKTKDRNGMTLGKWFSSDRGHYANEDMKRMYELPLIPSGPDAKPQPQYEAGSGHH